MLFVSLLLTMSLLLLAHWAFRRRGSVVGFCAFLVVGFAFSCGVPVLVWTYFPPVAFQFVFLLAALGLWQHLDRPPRLFLPLACIATAAAYGVTACFVLHHQQEFARLRQQVPYRSMEGRLPPPHQADRLASLPDPAVEHLGRLEESVQQRESFYRLYLLRELHEEKVSLFINNPGFGVSRLPLPSSRWLNSGLRSDAIIPQRGSLSVGEPGSPGRNADNLDQLHLLSVADFVNPGGFGFVKDRRHVAGFQPHQFSEAPKTTEKWVVQTLDLVSLLLHEEPVVYDSANLPRMDELRGVPTRTLDEFEKSALEKLQRGEDLVVADTPDGLCMLGALRSARQCMDCHGCQRGDLLGAFSYKFDRAK
jgi:hypothetical protein